MQQVAPGRSQQDISRPGRPKLRLQGHLGGGSGENVERLGRQLTARQLQEVVGRAQNATKEPPPSLKEERRERAKTETAAAKKVKLQALKEAQSVERKKLADQKKLAADVARKSAKVAAAERNAAEEALADVEEDGG